MLGLHAFLRRYEVLVCGSNTGSLERRKLLFINKKMYICFKSKGDVLFNNTLLSFFI